MTAAPDVVPEPAEWQSRGAAGLLRGRIELVDALRGAALAGMVAYHLAWDLHAFGPSSLDPGRSFGWHLIGASVAGTFLALSGFGLTLADVRGATLLAAARRLLRIAAAAAAVTLATWLTMPNTMVTFGILHCIVVTNAVALGLRRLGSVPVALLAIAAIAAPELARLPGAWSWTGVSGAEPATVDFRPVLPWLGPVLLGLLAARFPLVLRWAAAAPPSPVLDILAWLGRRSLAIYLVHQPILIAAVLVVAGARPSESDVARTLRQPSQASAFLHECANTCLTTGGDSALCVATCHCVLTAAAAHSAAVEASLLSRWIKPAAPLAEAIAACRRD